MNVIKPDSKSQECEATKVFLAGSIEMGAAPEWQTEFVKKFSEFKVTFFNPRREGWDSSWKQTHTEKEFNNQVNWELNKLDSSDIIFMHFSGDTKSPISLLELGLYATSEKMIVSCPKNFWRVGNVEIVCARHRIPFFYDIDEAAGSLQTMIRKLQA